MRPMVHVLRRACWCSLLILIPVHAGLLHAAEKSSAVLMVKDALTAPREPAAVEAKLLEPRLLNDAGLGGEPLELVIDGQVVATSMTGGDGRAVLGYTPKAPGVAPVLVKVGASPRVTPTEGQANLVVWERRHPIVVIEFAALVREPVQTGPLPAVGGMLQTEQEPMPDAAEELEKLTRFYYGVIYAVMPSTGGADGFQVSARVREWLNRHKFPPGYVMVLSAGDKTLGTKIDELHAAGWKTIRTGIGRTNAFAEAFLQRRLDAVLVTEPVQGGGPRKAKIARGWKEVRKKL
ncbi:MAG TPA: hypothetical protein VD738_09070 [Nitrospira sp.]|nr:hypothetical protein [Nitrospira sp.]